MTAGARALRIGTRGSELALWQARRVAELLAGQPGAPPVELVRIRTEGDARTDIPLWKVGGQAFFTREIDRAVRSGEVDAAVHSLKDLGTVLDEGFALTAVLEREDPRDALLVRAGVGSRAQGAGAGVGEAAAESPLAQLPAGARVGTSSVRRRAFLARARRDLQLLELRGNVPTRIDRLAEGRFDAIVLAAAGVKRLGLERHITAYLPCRQFTPAVSQGAIGVVCRETDVETARWLSALDDGPTRIETLAERALLRRVEGGCQVPLGAVGRLRGGRLTLIACVCAGDGSESIAAEGEVEIGVEPASRTDTARERAVRLGEDLAEELLAKGAGRIIAQQRAPAAVDPPSVVPPGVEPP
ncbi:MAG: hydroxymethylbilane synthase [Steroidobacteraceae bacterium]